MCVPPTDPAPSATATAPGPPAPAPKPGEVRVTGQVDKPYTLSLAALFVVPGGSRPGGQPAQALLEG
ncbi:hypothetical protein ABZ891_24440 [Streptomyces sp. NPDC047023]|uniref:hypothetical protein n=1 Tax=Streptomyces sp. NPDC047023 TaxID=3155139 RepID=UPI00340F208A